MKIIVGLAFLSPSSVFQHVMAYCFILHRETLMNLIQCSVL